jgi:RNA polymerase sigma-70 factor (subfamily 1)
MPASDENLLSLASSGHEDSLALLLERYGPLVRRGIAKQIPKRLGSLLTDDDVMQQTYADAFRSINSFESRGDGSFARWLATLARCNLCDAVRMLEAQKRGGGRTRIDQRAISDSFAPLLKELAAAGNSPSQEAAKAEARADLESAIKTLPPTYAQVVRMYDLEGRTIDEVAAALDRSVGAVYMLRSRAHDRLHDLLGRTSKYFGTSA